MHNKVVSVSLILLSSFILSGCTKKGPESNQTQSPKETMSEATEFAKAIESGKPTICTMSRDEDKMEYLIKGKKMRMNTTTSIADEAGKSVVTVGHMINDEKFMYFWDDKTKQGSKMAIPSEEETKKLAEDTKKLQADTKIPKFGSEAGFDTYKNEGYTVSCKAGAVDESVFTPPKDISFIDPTEMMKAIPSPDSMGNIDMSKLEELSKQYGGE